MNDQILDILYDEIYSIDQSKIKKEYENYIISPQNINPTVKITKKLKLETNNVRIEKIYKMLFDLIYCENKYFEYYTYWNYKYRSPPDTRLAYNKQVETNEKINKLITELSFRKKVIIFMMLIRLKIPAELITNIILPFYGDIPKWKLRHAVQSKEEEIRCSSDFRFLLKR